MTKGSPAADGSRSPATPRLRSKVLRAVLIAGAAMVLILAVAAAAEHHLEQRDRAIVDSEATFLSSHGRRIRYRLVGADLPGPVVVLVSGFGGSLEQWNLMQARLGSVAPTLAYDRGGTGFSDPIEDHDASTQAEEIASFAPLFAGKTPFIVVGYSSSGFIPGAFARLHPELLGGIVFLDVTPPEEVTSVTSWKGLYRQRVGYERLTAQLAAKALVGVTRFRYWLAARHSAPRSHEEELAEMVLDRASHWWAVHDEGVEIRRAAEEAKLDWSTIHVPVAVLSLARPDGDPASRERYRLHRQVAEQAPRGRLIYRPEWRHDQITAGPEQVAEVAQIISDVVTQVRGDRKP